MKRGFILAVVLVIVGLLALTMAGFTFFVRAEVSGVRAQRDAQQARLAAESALQEVIAALRRTPGNPYYYLNSPELFRHALVWSSQYDRQSDPVRKSGSREEILEQAAPVEAWRFSVVARNLDGPLDTIRFGITPEASKLNINSASEAEIQRLFESVLLELGIENYQELIAAFLDWRDEDDDPRPGGAEIEYYNTLIPAYRPKNGALDSIEEMLLIKGWTAALLYGEDTNRNGLLDANENDGDATPPTYDDADGVLAHGLAPYITVWSREPAPPGAQPGGGDRTGGGGGEQGGNGEFDDQEDDEGDEKESGRRQARRDDRAGAEGPGTGAQAPGTGTRPPGAGGDVGLPTGAPGGGGPFGMPSRPQFNVGRVNVSTAPLRVLEALDGMTPELAAQIVARRAEMSPEDLASPNWLAGAGLADPSTLATLADRLTTQALQFHVEAVGYGDHTKLARRLEWIIEVRGPFIQVVYHRDLTGLGFAWPVDDDTVLIRPVGQVPAGMQEAMR
ncbi:MAG: general secretion pathway protein GspK [Phycisphaerales bacterium]|nr:general secretion pathway protein GspK [Phycisphaerales bacterium]